MLGHYSQPNHFFTKPFQELIQKQLYGLEDLEGKTITSTYQANTTSELARSELALATSEGEWLVLEVRNGEVHPPRENEIYTFQLLIKLGLITFNEYNLEWKLQNEWWSKEKEKKERKILADLLEKYGIPEETDG